MPSTPELVSFIHEARTQGWANPNAAPTQNGGYQEYRFVKGTLLYNDIYSGNAAFGGREEVIEHPGSQDRLAWIQSYQGAIHRELRSDPDVARLIYRFLKQALMAGTSPLKFYPRGPHRLRDGMYTYTVSWNGGIDQYAGHEKITYEGKKVYQGLFFGMLIKD